jgi:ATP-dependent protease Clp ATPase subunit
MSGINRSNEGRCSFCTRPDVHVSQLVVAAEANICSSCVHMASELLAEMAKDSASLGWQSSPSPNPRTSQPRNEC